MQTENKNQKRNKVLFIALGVFITIGIIALLYHFFIGQYEESSDNAYVQGEIYLITPQTSGVISNVYVSETQDVKAGQLLASLDKADAQNALSKAEANLALSVRNFKKTNNDANSATSSVVIAQKELQNAQSDLKRREGLVASGAISKEEYAHTLQRVADAQSHLSIAQQNKNTANTIAGNSMANDPTINEAKTALKEAYLNLKRCDILSPSDGTVAKKSIQVGQRVAVGQNIMGIVGAKDMWVDANLKETQLKNIRIGQDAKVSVDAIGGDKEFDAKVVGISGGTGAAFSLLPAQNASGNWIKIVQRVPVRLALQNVGDYKNALRVGLSCEISIDTKNRDGGYIGSLKDNNAKPFDPYASADAQSDKIITKIIDQNR